MSDLTTELDADGPVHEALLREYRTFIVEILRRLEAMSESLEEAKASPRHADNWKNCDFCWFEMRKICEYLTLAIVLAHHSDGGNIADLRKWRPKELLAQVGNLNDHPTPLQVDPDFGKEHQIKPLSQPIRTSEISAIYGQCSELLHVGSLERILSGKLPRYDLSVMEKWIDGFKKLLRNHALLLPRIKRVLVFLDGRLLVLAGDGEGVFDGTSLPEFRFDQ